MQDKHLGWVCVLAYCSQCRYLPSGQGGHSLSCLGSNVAEVQMSPLNWRLFVSKWWGWSCNSLAYKEFPGGAIVFFQVLQRGSLWFGDLGIGNSGPQATLIFALWSVVLCPWDRGSSSGLTWGRPLHLSARWALLWALQRPAQPSQWLLRQFYNSRDTQKLVTLGYLPEERGRLW